MNEQAILLAALDIADPAERAAWVKRVCAGDATLLRQVESLLAAHLRSGAFLDVPALKQIAAGASEGRHSPDETSAEQDGAKAEIDLSFLQPSAKPGSLGRLGHYEVQEVIGRGGFGIVLKAFDEMLHRVVAIKVLAPELAATSPARKRFLREARAAAAIRHENVVSIYSVEEQPLPYLVMEYIAGQTLQQKLDQSGPLGVREVVQIGQQIATGLEAAHAMGLVHRDIKPGNILLENGVNRVKITDFGLARTSDDASLTQSGVIAGTPLYMSPEQAKGDVIDQRSDLFSLGSVLYVMCSGRPPFRAATTVAVLMRVVEDQPRPIQQIIPEVPEWLSAIIGKLHAKKPTDRFASAREVASLLARCLSDLQQHGKVESVGDVLPITAKSSSATREPVEGERSKSETGPIPAIDSRPPLPAELALTAGSRRSSPRRKTLIAVAAAAFVILAGVIVFVRDEKGNVIARILGQIAGVKSESSDGTPPDANKEAPDDDGTPVDAASPDRDVAEWVLSSGGQLRCQVAGKDAILGPSDTLPPGKLKVTCIWLYDKHLPAMRLSQLARLRAPYELYLFGCDVDDDTLSQLRGAPQLFLLNLNRTAITGAGLAEVAPLPQLHTLNILETAVTDAGLVELQRFPNLHQLVIQKKHLTPLGVANLLGNPNLAAIYLHSDVGDAELENLRPLSSLADLSAGGTAITDAGLEHLGALPNLAHLELGGPCVTDTGLARVAQLTKLTFLKVSGPEMSNTGLRQLHVLKNLTYLDVRPNYYRAVGDLFPSENKVTAAGVAELRKALPNCQVVWDDPAESTTADPDRRAAEWVLSVGGTFKITEGGVRERLIKTVGDLPQSAFELTYVDLNSNSKATDAGLAHFKDCKNLAILNLAACHVSDAGLAYFRDCKNLTSLDMNGTAVSDAGLAHFKDCKNLTLLNLSGTHASAAGLAYFRDKNLTGLWLYKTAVSDAGLAHFKGWTDLTVLDVRKTKVTAAGIDALKYALPQCKIEWDDGVIEPSPTTDPDRVAAEWVLSVGSAIKITENGTVRQVGAIADLPQGAFELSAAGLQDNPKVTDAGLAHFKCCKNLRMLNLNGTQVSNAGLAHFTDCKDLYQLSLGVTQVSDAGLAHFKDCEKLTEIALNGTQVSDAGLAYFKDCTNLTALYLPGTQISDAGLAHFKDCKTLTAINLATTRVSDAGLASLANLPSLNILELTATRISLRGHEQLKTAMPNCKIRWSETNRTVAEGVLALGGSVDIGTPGRPDSRSVSAVADLPREYFQVRRVSLAGVAEPVEKLPDHLGWLRFPEFDRLEGLDLSGIAGLDYGFLATIHGLEELSLANAGLTDESLAKLPKLPSLKRLVLDGNDIRGPGLTYLSELPELIDLSLGCPTLTDLTAKNLAELKQLKRLSLSGSGLTDAGIKHLVALTSLESLDLRGTRATAAGVAELQKALPKCRIEWSEGAPALERAK